MRVRLSGIVLALGMSGAAFGQAPAGTPTAKMVPDAEVEANVLRALAAQPGLASQPITTTTAFGTVTLTGSATDEASRTLAENTAAKALGVQKVVDELTVGGAAAAVASAPAAPEADSAGQVLQSDGTYAPADQSAQAAPGSSAPQTGSASSAQPGQATQGAAAYPPVGPDGKPTYRKSYDRNAPPAPAGYAPGGGAAPGGAYGAQMAGRPVTIPSGAMLRMRINEGLDSKHVHQGAEFDGIVLNDVVADGAVAIPRGASVQGTVVESKSSGSLGGKGELALELNTVTLGAVNYPIVTDNWGHEGMSKTGQSVGNAVGLGAFGAVLGAVFGGGPGALLGAAAGGGAGLATSAASGTRQVVVPPEAILTFHLVQPVQVKTVSEQEMDRLGNGVQPAQRLNGYRQPPPPPPPGYYPQPAYPYSY